ncbi:MAG: TetR/AcrR family transcriptional regulator [Phaeodactylibacter sp.]|nr:TetR/AcrR family transcriptional regulator [Phaeodactylibacter sp.]MCB9275138.1 TetR/AcrR family transcriptional regulator [Lewinellaceae bacterium]
MNTKGRILARAIALFNDQGVYQVGVRDIARELGISPGNLSYHFPKKEDLINEIMKLLSEENDQCYKHFFSGEVSLYRYLKLLRSIYNVQYTYRCIYLNIVEISKNMRAIGFDYQAVALRRAASLERIFAMLAEQGGLRPDLDAAEIATQVRFMSLINRFWLSEAAMQFHPLNPEEAISHYLRLVAYHLKAAVTEKGQAGITRFFQEYAEYD